MLLAIDTAGGQFSLALFSGGKLLELFVAQESNKQAENLVPEVEALLARHQLSYQQLTHIAANVGPGSFTGLRIGLAAVKAWQLVLPTQAVAVTSLEAAAFVKGGGDVCLDARRGQAFVQKFDANLNALTQLQMVDYVGGFDAPANAEAVGRVVLQKISSGVVEGKISPLYIRDADAKLPANRK